MGSLEYVEPIVMMPLQSLNLQYNGICKDSKDDEIVLREIVNFFTSMSSCTLQFF